MCGRFTIATKKEIAEAELGDIRVTEWQGPRYNVAPSQPVPAVRNDGRREVVWIRWGLVPAWAKDPAIGHRLINARAETLAEKPAFRDAFRRRRCAILADGFYEWAAPPGAARRVPHLFRLKGGGLFFFAGLWETWPPPEGPPRCTCTLVTTTPNELVARYHDRMPAILDRKAMEAWIDPAPRAPAELAPLLRPYPAEAMEVRPASPDLNRPHREGPELLGFET